MSSPVTVEGTEGSIDDDNISINIHSRSRVIEYEVMHNISRPISPMHLIVTSSSKEDKRWSGPTVSVTKPSSPDNSTQLNSSSIYGVGPAVSYKRIEPPSPIPNRKGKGSNVVSPLPERVREKGLVNGNRGDTAMIKNSKLNMNSGKACIRTKSHAPPILAQVKLDDSKRYVRNPTRAVADSLSGNTVALGEAREQSNRIRIAKIKEQQKIRRYGHGISPSQRISKLQTDLQQVIFNKQRQQGGSALPLHILQTQLRLSSSSSIIDNSFRSTDALPSQIIRVEMPARRSQSPTNQNTQIDGNRNSICSNSMAFSDECSDIAPDKSQPLKPPTTGDEGSIASTLSGCMSVPTDMKISDDIIDSPAGPSAFALATMAKREASFTAGSTSPNSRPNSRGRTRGHTTGGMGSELFQSESMEMEQLTSPNERPPVRHPNSVSVQEVESQNEIMESVGEDAAKGMTVIVRTQSRETAPEVTTPSIHAAVPVHPIPSRYSSGDIRVTELPHDSSTRELSGNVRRVQNREIEIKARIHCVMCMAYASIWCVECQRSYCAQCWNSVPHHEFVDPKEAWQHRCPKHTVNVVGHSVTGLHVHMDSRGGISRRPSSHGAYSQKYRGARTLSKTLSQFPSTDSIMENGFNHAEQWADLNDESSFYSEGSSKITGSQKASRYAMKLDVSLINDDDLDSASNFSTDDSRDEFSVSNKGTPCLRGNGPRVLSPKVCTVNGSNGNPGSHVGASRMQLHQRVKPLNRITRK